ncbi:unnamed protein product [Diatraea saccharalis]|nr:unnamed protein product [Diatraea saccharalis]
MGTLYEHGDRYTPKQCAVTCVCHDGNMQCGRVNPEKNCPKLPCDIKDQFSVPGECCKFCPGVDYCSMGHSCDENATCMNLNTKYTCTCNQGFQGDGLTCEDVDECQEEGGLRGHHCHSNTRCVNVVGSYVCQCLPGYERKDKFNCYEVTICTGGCLNGGVCEAPEQCKCPHGFAGSRCERDVDECVTAAHPGDMPACGPRALCVNTPGSYYCVCRAGYRRDTHLDYCEGNIVPS